MLLRSRLPRNTRQAGLTLVELVIASFVALTGISIYAALVGATAGQRGVHREYAIASNAARMAIEDLRDVEFSEVFARFNETARDDPPAGTSPGHRFVVEGLAPLDSARDGAHGTIFLPSQIVVEAGASHCELREDLDDPALDLPRDLSGDGITDDADHAGDYRILPVRVLVEWASKKGARSLELSTLLAEVRK